MDVKVIGLPADVHDDKKTAEQWEVLYNYGIPCPSYLDKACWMVPKRTTLGGTPPVLYINASHDPNVVIDYHWVRNKYCIVAEVKLLKEIKLEVIICVYYMLGLGLGFWHVTRAHYVPTNQCILYVLQPSNQSIELLCGFDNVYRARGKLLADHSKLATTPSQTLGTDANPIEVDNTPVHKQRWSRLRRTRPVDYMTLDDPQTVRNKYGG